MIPLSNPAPLVVPSLREWQGGNGTFTLGSASHIVVDPANAAKLQGTAKVFHDDLLDLTGFALPIVQSGTPRRGDFFLSLSAADSGIGNEGYVLNIGSDVIINANASTGVLYGTQTVLQILVQDPARAHIPTGNARDYPYYKERGFMLDVGRKFFPLTELEDYVRLMAWYKMNDFHIHFNDNEIDGGSSPDWMHKYAAFRLNSPNFPGLAAKDGSYTEQDIRELQNVAADNGVTITPEIDTPAHSLALTQYRPDLASPKYSKEFLDLDNPATYTFMDQIWDTFLPWFNTKQIDIGVDEYSPNAADKYREYINTYIAYLKQRGKTARMWGSLSEMQSSVPVNTSAVTDLWNNTWANPVDTVRQGFDVINANDNLLYIVPKAGYYHDYLDTQLLYERWEPYIFSLTDPSLNLQPGDPHLLGGMFSVWNDKLGSVVGDADVHDRVKPAMQTIGQKLWSGPTPETPYDEFQQIATALDDAPQTHLPEAANPNLALGKHAMASSSETVDFTPNKAVDGSRGTRWSSGYTDDEWFGVDLGQSYALGSVALNWGTAYAKGYQIQVSNDGSHWADVYSTENGHGGIERINLFGVTARYVRMQGLQRATDRGYSLWEFAVYPATTPPTTGPSVPVTGH